MKSLCDKNIHRWNYFDVTPDCFIDNIFVAVHYEQRFCRKCHRFEHRRTGFFILGGENSEWQKLDEPFIVITNSKEGINEEVEKDFHKKLRENADIVYGKNKIIT